MKVGSDCMCSSRVTTSAAVVRSALDSPEPSLNTGWSPSRSAIAARTTAAPSAVVPSPPSRAPRSFSSVSAKKLSEGELVSSRIVASGGEEIDASVRASAGVTPMAIRVRFGSPDARRLQYRRERLRSPQRRLWLQRALGAALKARVVCQRIELPLELDARPIAGRRRATFGVEVRPIADDRAVDLPDAGALERGDQLLHGRSGAVVEPRRSARPRMSDRRRREGRASPSRSLLAQARRPRARSS